jgi:hypothetical protein
LHNKKTPTKEEKKASKGKVPFDEWVASYQLISEVSEEAD